MSLLIGTKHPTIILAVFMTVWETVNLKVLETPTEIPHPHPAIAADRGALRHTPRWALSRN